jgi:hypothetical protein
VKRFFFLKWLNNLLPVQEHMHRYGQASLAGCRDGCGCLSEDQLHLLRCPAPHRQEVLDPMLEDLDTLFLTHTIDPHLRRVLLTLVDPSWGDPTEVHLPSEYKALLRFQHTLHADSVFLCCFSKEWTRLQHNYLRLNNLSRGKRQAATGIKQLILYLLDLAHAMLLKRNTALHSDDATTQLLSYKHTMLLLEIQDLYDQQALMLADDRKIFTKPYTYWIDQPTSQLKTFLQQMRATVKASMEQTADVGAHFRPIDSYFPPTIPQGIFDVILGTTYHPPEPD